MGVFLETFNGNEIKIGLDDPKINVVLISHYNRHLRFHLSALLPQIVSSLQMRYINLYVGWCNIFCHF